MVQLVTPLASALARWDDGPAGYVMWPFVVVKMLLVGVVYMHRLDDRRMVRVVDGGGTQRRGVTRVLISILTCHWIATFRAIHDQIKQSTIKWHNHTTIEHQMHPASGRRGLHGIFRAYTTLEALASVPKKAG